MVPPNGASGAALPAGRFIADPTGRGMPPLNAGWVCTRPCVAEKKLLSAAWPVPAGAMCGCVHHEAAVD